jgi:2-polyprenyl-3-methyl-5-hydroxy-6-metoxy-1,4-benzoquinol methylase
MNSIRANRMPKESIKKIIRLLIPLPLRKRLAVSIYHKDWCPPHRKDWWTLEILRDFAANDINEYHKFLWSHHMAYAKTYETGLRFGNENMEASRKIFFSELKDLLVKLNVNPETDISTICEVGCSLGYQLRYLETDLFTGARELRGIDIDQYAIEAGAMYLRDVRSKVKLACADMEEIESTLGDRSYDILVCTGTLMYLNEASAAHVVDVMLRHTGTVLAIAGLAHPEIDNCLLQQSTLREQDKSFIHNLDFMVKKAGGTILARRWDGGKMVGGHTIYLVFASKNSN